MGEVAAGDDPDQLPIMEYRQVADSAIGYDAHGFFDGRRGIDTKRIFRHHRGYICAIRIDAR